jgi:hypothetical protein
VELVQSLGEYLTDDDTTVRAKGSACYSRVKLGRELRFYSHCVPYSSARSTLADDPHKATEYVLQSPDIFTYQLVV